MIKIFKRWFWIPERDNENSAQTTFRVLGNIFRWIITIVISTIIAFAIAIYLEKESQKQRHAERDNVKILSVEFDITSCASTTPIKVMISNNTNKVVEKLDLKFTAREQGRSTNLITSYSLSSREWDFIINPQSVKIGCYGFGEFLNEASQKLIWSAEISKYSLIFAD